MECMKRDKKHLEVDPAVHAAWKKKANTEGRKMYALTNDTLLKELELK